MINEIFTIASARQRRAKILRDTSSQLSTKGRYKKAYDKVMSLARRTKNSVIKLRAKKDAAYFKRRLERFK